VSPTALLRRGGGPNRWHSLVNCNHGDLITNSARGGRRQVKIADMGLSKKLEECAGRSHNDALMMRRARHLLATATQYAVHFD
jgi:hypothetical protein